MIIEYQALTRKQLALIQYPTCKNYMKLVSLSNKWHPSTVYYSSRSAKRCTCNCLGFMKYTIISSCCTTDWPRNKQVANGQWPGYSCYTAWATAHSYNSLKLVQHTLGNIQNWMKVSYTPSSAWMCEPRPHLFSISAEFISRTFESPPFYSGYAQYHRIHIDC